MRVAAVIHQFPPGFETGTEILCLRSMQALMARGHQVTVFAADPLRRTGAAPSLDEVEGVRVVRIPSRRPHRVALAARMTDEFENKPAATHLLAAVRDFAPDVIHTYQLLQFGLSAVPGLAIIAPLVGTATDFHLACPLVTAMLEDGTPCPGPGPDGLPCALHYRDRERRRIASAKGAGRMLMAIRGLAGRLAGLDSPRRFAAIMQRRQTITRAALRSYANLMIGPPRLLSMLDMAANPAIERLGHAAPPLNVPTRPVTAPLSVGFFSTLAAHKGLHTFLDAIAQIPAEIPLRFVICGPPGPDADYVRAQEARARAEPRIAFKPGVPHAQMGTALGDADIVVVPSLWDENEPLVLLDALEAGRYAVVSDRQGLTNPLGQGGTAFPPGDAAALAAILQDLARHPDVVQRVRAAPTRSSQFPAYIDAVENRYRRAMRPPATLHPPQEGS